MKPPPPMKTREEDVKRTPTTAILLTPEEMIQAASNNKNRQQQLEQHHNNNNNDCLVKLRNNEHVDKSSTLPLDGHDGTSRGWGITATTAAAEANDDDARTDDSTILTSSVPNPPRLQRQALHVLPGAYRTDRQRIVALVPNHRYNNKNQNTTGNSNGGIRMTEDGPRRRSSSSSSRIRPHDEVDDAAVTTYDERAPGCGEPDYDHRLQDGSNGSTTLATTTATGEEDEDDEDDQHHNYDNDHHHHHPLGLETTTDGTTAAAVTLLEAELVVDHHPLTVKAEPMRNVIRRWLTLIVLILSLVIGGIFLLRYVLSLTQTKFPYYTHHSVFFASSNNTINDLQVVMECDHGAVPKSDGQLCREQSGKIVCRLGNVLGVYKRNIFFSCGSNKLIDTPKAMVSATAVSGTGVMYLCVFQLCHEVEVEQNTMCDANSYFQQIEEDTGEMLSLCSSYQGSTHLTVTNVGISCPSDQRFRQTDRVIKFAYRKQTSIRKWLEKN